ncbi:MAG: phage replisome organizer N-terminal domain-containing protein, partial [Erysipelotrichaceae bacterium]|nr:phage replisome organizer N-terminal domain-containing protein [Erysipelotrichaceae bacterium]
MTAVKWIKLVSDLFDNRKIKQIRKMPECDAIIVIWLQILCLAGHTNDNGLIYFSKDIPYTDEMLSTEFDRPVATIRLALSVLVRFGMIEIVNGILMVSNWEKYQSQTRLESIRDYNR